MKKSASNGSVLGRRGALIPVKRESEIQASWLSAIVSSSDDAIIGKNLQGIAQESLNNAAKHSRASEITTTLAQHKGTIMLRIEDNGQGLPKPKNAGSGVGLGTMRHRAHVMGATLEINSTRGKSACVTCTLKERT